MSHWYTAAGELVTAIPMSTKEGTREPTIRDARKLGLYPSVTTIISLLNKPMLNNWRVEQGVKAALGGTWPGASESDIIKEVVRKSEEYVIWTAEFGTAVHQGIESRLTNKPAPPVGLLGVGECLEGLWPVYEALGLECTEPETTFVNHEHGFAGTADWRGWRHGAYWIIDAKTQDAESEKDFQFYDEWPLQLAGYAVGLEERHAKRGSLLISRTRPGLVVLHEWEDPELYDAAFLYLWNFWKLVKRWN